MSLDLRAMLQFAIAASAVLGLCMWLLYFLFIRPALRKQNLQSLSETSMSFQDIAEAEEVQVLTAFRALPSERKVLAIKLVEALK